MSLGNSLRTGLKFVLMSLGVSSPEKKPAPRPAAQTPKPEADPRSGSSKQ